MQVILIKDCWGPNPDFDKSKPLSRKTNWPERVVPKGTILDDPLAYYHCRGEDPNAAPYDDEAKQLHAEYLEWLAEMLAARAQRAAENAEADEDGSEAEDEEVPERLTPILPKPVPE